MTSVLFVHGTGTREPTYSQTFHIVQRALNDRRADLRVVPCYWGGPEGSTLAKDGASIPLYDSTRSVEYVGDSELIMALWLLLRQDPLYELRLLAQDRPAQAVPVPGRLTPGAALGQQVARLTIAADLQHKLDQGGIANQIYPAQQTLIANPVYQEVLQAATEPLNPYRTAVARALVALASARTAAQGHYVPITGDAPLRDQVVADLATALGPADRGFTASVLKSLYGLAASLGAMDHVRRKRGALTDAVFPFAGDVLRYQARGKRIRDYIREAIVEEAHHDGTIVLLAHSLGGIACVEMLVEQRQPEVKLLITVGSQAPFLYELGALATLGPDEPLPRHFPAWLNIYDLRDFLSYIGRGVFGEQVKDLPVDNRQYFPDSHGAYWTNPVMWDAILERLP